MAVRSRRVRLEAALGRLALAVVLVAAACSSTRSSRPSPEPPGDRDIRRIAEALSSDGELAERRIVGFGETTHGTHEFRALFFETALAVARRGEDVTVALEWDPRLGYYANEWAEGRGSTGAKGNAQVREWVGRTEPGHGRADPGHVRADLGHGRVGGGHGRADPGHGCVDGGHGR